MQAMMPIFMIVGGLFVVLAIYLAFFTGPSTSKTRTRRLSSVRERHGGSSATVEAQMRKIISNRPAAKVGLNKLVPDAATLQKRITATGKNWTVGRYFLVSIGIMVVLAVALLVKGAPIALAIVAPLAVGIFLPHMVLGHLIKARLQDFNKRFPDSIELMVRGLRSGLPITETIGIVSTEVPGAVGVEFKAISDRMRIGRTMDEAMQEAAERIDTPEFQFFGITLAIQRETGGNLAETLGNLADVLRKRAQMRLKIRAMSSEAKASAWIVGSLPFIVFLLVYTVNPEYLAGFFVEPKLIVAGLVGMIWLSIGAFIMAKMVNFEI
jgi:tight adherence protein B